MFPTPTGADVYRRLQVESRTPLELVVMLYDGALARIGEARAAIDREDFAAFREAIGKALAIVGELQNRLDMKAGGDIARSLDSLYSFVVVALIDASVRGYRNPLDGVEKVLSNLRDAWNGITGHEPSA
jgi:flagellar protein FliS